MDEKNLAILMKLREQLIEEERREQDAANRLARKREVEQKCQRERMKAAATREKELAAREASRRRISSHSNIARSYSSGESSPHFYYGGDVRPK